MAMKTQLNYRFAALAAVGLMALSCATAEEPAPRTFCRFVPERSDDFAWENDLIAFRAYGPALRDGAENGGVDCWLKRVDYPIVDKWYAKHVAGGTYHEDSGEGYDPYHVGSTLGCGGIGLWLDGKLVTSETFVDSKVISCEPDESVFELSYAWEHDGHSYELTKRMSIAMGERLFKSVATFKKDGEIAAGLPVAIGLTTHDGKAVASKNLKQGWVSCWETIDGSDLGTGVLMHPKQIDDYELIESDVKDASHALLISKTDENGQIAWMAGYGWARADDITTPKAWERYLAKFKSKK